MAHGLSGQCSQSFDAMPIEPAICVQGVDMLWLEMMKDEEHAFRAIEASVSSGLPIVVGISARTDKETGSIVLWGTGENSIPLSTDW